MRPQRATKGKGTRVKVSQLASPRCGLYSRVLCRYADAGTLHDKILDARTVRCPAQDAPARCSFAPCAHVCVSQVPSRDTASCLVAVRRTAPCCRCRGCCGCTRSCWSRWSSCTRRAYCIVTSPRRMCARPRITPNSGNWCREPCVPQFSLSMQRVMESMHSEMYVL